VRVKNWKGKTAGVLLVLIAFVVAVVPNMTQPVKGVHVEQQPDQWYHYAIFEKPKDYPHGWVIRKFLIEAGKVTPTDQWWTANSLEEARSHVPSGLTKIVRQPGDPPFLVETWI
jgi:hypothetical protein